MQAMLVAQTQKNRPGGRSVVRLQAGDYLPDVPPLLLQNGKDPALHDVDVYESVLQTFADDVSPHGCLLPLFFLVQIFHMRSKSTCVVSTSSDCHARPSKQARKCKKKYGFTRLLSGRGMVGRWENGMRGPGRNH